jgi:hypothetical protein
MRSSTVALALGGVLAVSASMTGPAAAQSYSYQYSYMTTGPAAVVAPPVYVAPPVMPLQIGQAPITTTTVYAAPPVASTVIVPAPYYYGYPKQTGAEPETQGWVD